MEAVLSRKFLLAVFFALWLAAGTGVGARSVPESAIIGPSNGTLEGFTPIGAIKIEYDLSKAGAGSYAGLHSRLHQVLATSRIVEGIPVLVRQTLPGSPPTWILITLTSGSAKVTLAVRNDNVYVAGFSNAAGTWFAFRRFERQITGSARLRRTDDYPSLIGGNLKLKDFDVSKQAVLQALTFLSTYEVPVGEDNNHDTTLGISLARLALIVVVSESARFKRIYDTVLQGLKDKALMTDEEAKLVVLWGKISRQLMIGQWKQDDELKNAGIKGKQDAIDSLKVLLWPKDVKVQQHLPVAGNATCNNATSFCNN